jgi:prevent-host-death family protein
MYNFPKMTTAREIQRNYKKIFDEVQKTGEPVVVMRNNKPTVTIVDSKKLSEIEAIMEALESREEIDRGEGKVLRSLKDLR